MRTALYASLIVCLVTTGCQRQDSTGGSEGGSPVASPASETPPSSTLPSTSDPKPEPGTVRVTADNYGRAMTDLTFANVVRTAGGLGKFDHNREVTPLDKQVVPRQNRDTLYSPAVFDLDAGPVTITLPDVGERFMSMQVFDQDQYTHQVAYAPGRYVLRREDLGTRYAMAALRMFVNPNDPADVRQVHAKQDEVRVSQPGGPGKFEIPRWDTASLTKLTEALTVLGDSLPDKNLMFGSKKDVDPVRRLIGVGTAWGGNPEKDAIYLNVTPSMNDGKTVYRLTVKDVPVDGFWSVTVYNAKGFFEQNPLNAYSLNNITAQKGEDGSVTVQFGGCDRSVPNCLPVTPGWNYMVRLYQPRDEILKGRWKFPEAAPISETAS